MSYNRKKRKSKKEKEEEESCQYIYKFFLILTLGCHELFDIILEQKIKL